jgi:hypothetical protein
MYLPIQRTIDGQFTLKTRDTGDTGISRIKMGTTMALGPAIARSHGQSKNDH